jgi:RimJ/RimL family protein N-acetyltransferase
MSDVPLRLRPAERTDAYALWLWANDPETREASHHRRLIPWLEHCAWLEAQLVGADALLLVAETPAGQPVGTARFETTDDWNTARLSYSLAPEVRGLGLSRQLISRAIARLAERSAWCWAYAEVTTTNIRSLKVFRGLGWREEEGWDGMRRFVSGEGDPAG